MCGKIERWFVEGAYGVIIEKCEEWEVRRRAGICCAVMHELGRAAATPPSVPRSAASANVTSKHQITYSKRCECHSLSLIGFDLG